MTTYQEFLARKHVRLQKSGFEVPLSEINRKLFGWQREIVRWSVRCGRAALFEDCGLGKTAQQLEWARLVSQQTNGRVLLLCPLAVQSQTKREAGKFEIDTQVSVNVVESQSEVQDGISITNYEKLHHFDTSQFVGVVLDESSILKAYTGATKRALCERFASTPYKLACTATPAPNDRMELGNHSEFLGVMPSDDMLARWFINDGGKAGTYRLRKHGERDFWRWMASWSVCISSPADLGFDAGGFDLPDLVTVEHVIDCKAESGYLFAVPRAVSATNVHREKRAYLEERADVVAGLVNHDTDCWAVWCDTDYEADALVDRIPDAVEVRGSDSPKFKEASVEWFLGHICDCMLSTIRKGGKLAACGKQNTLSDAETSTQKALLNESDGKSRDEPEKPTESTCEPTTKRTRQSSRGIKNKQQTNVIEGDASDTQQTKTFEMLANRPHVAETKSQSETAGSKATSELPPPNTTGCYSSKTDVAQYAERLLPTEESTDFTSITAMSPGESEDFSAEAATSDLANSKTITKSSTPHICTCGGIKHHRVLISKPEIFGLGLNFQHCHKTTWFAGYSYERFYQSLRRLWRYGQTKDVEVHVIRTVNEGSIVDTIERKRRQHAEMQREMAGLMGDGMREELGFGNQPRKYVAEHTGSVPVWLRRKEYVA